MPTLSLKFEVVDAGNGLKQLNVDARAFEKIVKDATRATREWGNEVVECASTANVFNAFKDAVTELNSVVQNLTSAYQSQVEVETQLAVNMRNTMAAREEDIQSIKDLCAAQQQIGVIGDEVQLAGAQELATYLSEKQSLERLIPVMNDMLAQQYGLNASQENAAQIASMLGKVMEGQTGALKRYGYSFDEAQEQILKYGTEAERAAVLCDVVSSAVGGMNAELAKTDAGKAKQMANSLGDLKEQLGGMMQGIAPIVSLAANVALAAAGVGKLWASMKGAAIALKSLKVVQVAYNAVLAKTTISTTAAASASAMLRTKYAALPPMLRKVAIAYNTATTAGKLFMAATGIGLAVTVITTVASMFSSAADEMAESLDRLTDAQEIAKRAAEDEAKAVGAGAEAGARARMQIEEHIKKVNEFSGTKAQEQKLLNELRSTYGGVMGDFKTLADWYTALTKNSETYCRQMILEAKIAHYKNKIVAGEAEYTELTGKEYQRGVSEREATEEYNAQKAKADSRGDSAVQQIKNTVSGTSALGGLVAWVMDGTIRERVEEVKRETLADAAAAVSAAQSVEAAYAGMEKAIAEASELEMPVMGSPEPYSGGGGGTASTTQAEQTRLQQINALIEAKKLAYTTASESSRKAIQQEIGALMDEKKGIELLIESAARPLELKSLSDYDREIAFQNRLLQEADETLIKDIQDNINRLQKARAELVAESHNPVDVDKISTYDELDKELQHYSEQLKTATVDERVQIQQRINELHKLKDAWDEVLARVEKPADISTLDTIKELQKAVQQYRTLQQSATADEYQGYAVTIKALEEKIAAMQRGARLVEMQSQMDAFQGLTGQDFAIEIQAIGLDGIEDMIRELQRMLADAANPLTDSQKEMAEGLIGTLNEVGRNDALGGLSKKAKAAWSEVGNLGSAFSGLGSALEIPAFDVVGTLAQAVANMVLSYSTALGESATMGPIGWVAFAAAGLAQLTAVIASVKNVAKFADGGIAYGPTLGLFGEYAGASSNPEVVAPLSKLTELIEPREAAIVAGHVVFDIDGRKLTGVLQNVQRLSYRS